MQSIANKLNRSLPNHAYHVLNIYKRTGHDDSLHTLASMEACLILWGTVVEKQKLHMLILTTPLVQSGDTIMFGKEKIRTIYPQSNIDSQFDLIKTGDLVAYHWGLFIKKLTKRQYRNLSFFTRQALALTNSYETGQKKYLYYR